MFILTQDKNTIVSTETATEIFCGDKEIGAEHENGRTFLGRYDTPERAKEVLLEIFERLKCQNPLPFEMPQE